MNMGNHRSLKHYWGLRVGGQHTKIRGLLLFFCSEKLLWNHHGMRHYWGLRVRGRHTKITGRGESGVFKPRLWKPFSLSIMAVRHTCTLHI
ncbi:40S ribosomal protein S18-like isoform X3 [Papaver somniferum]|uniref:40S ribosomal protein S18-like isoform X3 n=1 Tax=Papaver somniferum TaxID=3469 RepID=UPI000E701C2E|nr:40S ribosomal protein S18-like isoform X3 [Papaver somniferum]